MELLNRELAPIKVSGFRKYHSSFNVTADHFKIEPDMSLGMSGVELITGPLEYPNVKLVLLKILKIMQEFCRTDEKCSIHVNISFDPKKVEPTKTLDHLNKLKLILEIDEEMVYKYFPTRKNNFYAKSVKKIIPFKDYSYANTATNLLILNKLMLI